MKYLEVDMKEPAKDKEKSKVAEKSLGVKHKHNSRENPRKKDNSKNAYKRRVVAYKRKHLEIKENGEILLPTSTM